MIVTRWVTWEWPNLLPLVRRGARVDPLLWQRVEQALHQALALDEPNRTAFVAALDDAEVRTEVASLLAADGARPGPESGTRHFGNRLVSSRARSRRTPNSAAIVCSNRSALAA